jgi:hypothetical protein
MPDMAESRNELCRCGSGRKFKKCCGAPAARRAPSAPLGATPQPIPYEPDLGVERFGDANSSDPFEAHVSQLIRRGNLAMALLHVRDRLARSAQDAKALNMLGWIACAAGLWTHAARHFSSAIAANPRWSAPQRNLERIAHRLHALPTPASAGERFLLIKAWGFGFWSDVSHVLGQLLVARVTMRTPVVHWGTNSLFHDAPSENAWTEFFEPLSGTHPSELAANAIDIWPPKWSRESLLAPECQKNRGPYSRVAGIWTLARSERVLVSDFFASLLELTPWIPSEHPLYGLSVHAIARELVRDHLRPTTAVAAAVSEFCARQLPSTGYLAVHARGSDKALETRQLDSINRDCFARIDGALAAHHDWPLFLMTDDERILAEYRVRYGDRVVTTACTRTRTDQGIHYQSTTSRAQLGREVLIDALVAARADAFIGNGFSNASVMVGYLREWPEGACTLLGSHLFETPNPGLHAW